MKLKNRSAYLYEAALLVNTIRPIEPVDAVFFHGRSFEGDDDGLFELARDLITIERLAPRVVVNGSDGRSFLSKNRRAWPGVQNYMTRLTKFGVREICVSEPALHTRAENEKFIALARQKGWKRAIVIAQPHQLLRIMLGALDEMRKVSYPMAIYPIAPRHVNWHKAVFGSQADRKTPRFEQIAEELQRIKKYRVILRNLETFEDLVAYLRSIGSDA